jgi:hypothetical protein
MESDYLRGILDEARDLFLVQVFFFAAHLDVPQTLARDFEAFRIELSALEEPIVQMVLVCDYPRKVLIIQQVGYVPSLDSLNDVGQAPLGQRP